MLTGGDEYPLHQMPEPVALVTDRNFYDRFFYNGYSPDGRIFFAAAMGVYPALDVIDGAFCVMIDGVQHNLRASGWLNGERLAMRVGPVSRSICFFMVMPAISTSTMPTLRFTLSGFP